MQRSFQRDLKDRGKRKHQHLQFLLSYSYLSSSQHNYSCLQKNNMFAEASAALPSGSCSWWHKHSPVKQETLGEGHWCSLVPRGGNESWTIPGEGHRWHLRADPRRDQRSRLWCCLHVWNPRDAAGKRESRICISSGSSADGPFLAPSYL